MEIYKVRLRDVRVIPANLICHNHQSTISQTFRRLVLLVMLQSHDLLDILNLLVLHNLIMTGFANIEKLSSQRKHAKVVTSNNRETRHSQSLGRVSFSKDEGARGTLAGTGIIGVTEFGHAVETAKLA